MLGGGARRAVVLLLCPAALASACSSGGVSGTTKAYVDAIAASYAQDQASTMTRPQAECSAKAVLETVGEPTLQQRGLTPDKLRKSAALDKIQPTQAQRAQFASALQKCRIGNVVAPAITKKLFKTEHPGGAHCLAQVMDRDPATEPLFEYAQPGAVLTKDAATVAAKFVDRCFDLAQTTLDDSTLVDNLSDPERACVINDARNRGVFIDLYVLQFMGKHQPTGAQSPILGVLRRCLPPERLKAPVAGV